MNKIQTPTMAAIIAVFLLAPQRARGDEAQVTLSETPILTLPETTGNRYHVRAALRAERDGKAASVGAENYWKKLTFQLGEQGRPAPGSRVCVKSEQGSGNQVAPAWRVIMLIDTSISMATPQDPLYPQALAAAKAFFDQLRQSNTNVLAAVESFDCAFRWRSDYYKGGSVVWRTDRAGTDQALQAIEARVSKRVPEESGCTALNNAVLEADAALQQLAQSEKDGRQIALVIIGDGNNDLYDTIRGTPAAVWAKAGCPKTGECHPLRFIPSRSELETQGRPEGDLMPIIKDAIDSHKAKDINDARRQLDEQYRALLDSLRARQYLRLVVGVGKEGKTLDEAAMEAFAAGGGRFMQATDKQGMINALTGLGEQMANTVIVNFTLDPAQGMELNTSPIIIKLNNKVVGRMEPAALLPPGASPNEPPQDWEAPCYIKICGYLPCVLLPFGVVFIVLAALWWLAKEYFFAEVA